MDTAAVTGVDDLQATLKQMRKALAPQALQADALAAVQPMLADAEASIPVRTGHTQHLLHAVSQASAQGGVGIVEVAESGPGQPGHDAIFLEYGTSKMAPKPFLRPAFYRRQAEALRIVAQRLAQRLSQF